MVGRLLQLANWPFTMLVIMPTNEQLMTMQPQDAGAESRRLLRLWSSLHGARSALGSAAALLFACSLLITYQV